MIALYIIGGLALIIFVLLMLNVRVTVRLLDDLTYTAKLGPFLLDLEKDEDEKEKKRLKRKSAPTRHPTVRAAKRKKAQRSSSASRSCTTRCSTCSVF